MFINSVGNHINFYIERELTVQNSDGKYVARAGKRAAFTVSLLLSIVDYNMLVEIAKLVYMRRLQWRGHVPQCPTAGDANDHS